MRAEKRRKNGDRQTGSLGPCVAWRSAHIWMQQRSLMARLKRNRRLGLKKGTRWRVGYSFFAHHTSCHHRDDQQHDQCDALAHVTSLADLWLVLQDSVWSEPQHGASGEYGVNFDKEIRAEVRTQIAGNRAYCAALSEYWTPALVVAAKSSFWSVPVLN